MMVCRAWLLQQSVTDSQRNLADVGHLSLTGIGFPKASTERHTQFVGICVGLTLQIVVVPKRLPVRPNETDVIIIICVAESDPWCIETTCFWWIGCTPKINHEVVLLLVQNGHKMSRSLWVVFLMKTALGFGFGPCFQIGKYSIAELTAHLIRLWA